MKSKKHLFLFVFLWAIAVTAIIYIFYQKVTRNTFDANPSCPIFFKELQICSSLQWITIPNIKNPNIEVELHFWKIPTEANNYSPVPIDVDHLTLELFMPDMGHGSAPIDIEHLNLGHYKAKNLKFLMFGYWELKINLKNLDQTTSQAILSVKCLKTGECSIAKSHLQH